MKNIDREAMTIATELAGELFINGGGDMADRLKLEGANGRNLGGLCFGAARDRLAGKIKQLILVETAKLRRQVQFAADNTPVAIRILPTRGREKPQRRATCWICRMESTVSDSGSKQKRELSHHPDCPHYQ